MIGELCWHNDWLGGDKFIPGRLYMIYHNYKKFNQIWQKSQKGGNLLNLHASDIHMVDAAIKLCMTQNFLFYCSQLTYWPFEDYVMTEYLEM
jgi:hypothetical protein